MNYKESIGKKLMGEMEEVTRLKDLWGEIVKAFEEGGEDSIKSVLSQRVDEINKNFKGLLDKLRKRL